MCFLFFLNFVAIYSPVIVPGDDNGYIYISVLDLGLISIGSLGPRASTKVESHVNFTESQKVSQPNFFAILNTEKLAKTTN